MSAIPYGLVSCGGWMVCEGLPAPNGLVVYQGPSMLDGAPIVAVMTGTRRPSQNAKTGPMLQVWILPADVEPRAAVHSGADRSVCGGCPLRGVIDAGRNIGRACYVRVAEAPLSVWRAWKADRYGQEDAGELARAVRGRAVRLGAYGDPAALPFGVIERLTHGARRWTGYTHQWRTAPAALARFVMASVETPEGACEAHALGYRTFRVSATGEPAAGEIVCPAAKESGARTTCARCGLCAGTSRRARNVVIRAHGNGARNLGAVR